MQRYSVIVMSDSTAPVRRFEIEKRLIVRSLWGGGIIAALLCLGLVDYVRVRIDQIELDGLRAEAAQQREKIARFETTLSEMNTRMGLLREFERKVRIIANLPGTASSGGGEITGLDPAAGGAAGELADSEDSEDSAQVGSETLAEGGVGGDAETATAADAVPAAPADRVSVLRQDLEQLDVIANARELSLLELIEQLESKRRHLASSPAIWPTKGWLTSRFGYRVSPFTGKKQFHAGIDIAGARGTDVVAPARGTVSFVGTRGPLGNSLIIDHGYGVKTLYGHTEKVHVKRGQEVERGERIASLGSTGRSTGPHLHYVVEVNGKARNPLDYIFD